MEHDKTELTDDERRIFAEIERSIDAATPGSRRWHRRARRLVDGWPTRWLVALLGSGLLIGGLAYDTVVLAAAGFLVLVIGLSRAIPTGVSRRTFARLRRWLAGTAPRVDDTGSGRPRC